MREHPGNRFVDEEEGILALIGPDHLNRFLTDRGTPKGIGVLTPKRFYFDGRNYAAPVPLLRPTEKGVVSVEDVICTVFRRLWRVGLLIAALLCGGSGVLLLVLSYAGCPVTWILLLAAAILLVLFFTSRQTLFVVTFYGGSFGFNVKYYPLSELQDFRRQLHLVKDRAKRPDTAGKGY